MDLRPQPQTPASAWGYSTDYCTTAHSTTTTLDHLTDTRRDYKQPPEPRFRPAYPDYRKHRMLPVGLSSIATAQFLPRHPFRAKQPRLGADSAAPANPTLHLLPESTRTTQATKILSKNPGSVHLSKSKIWFCSLAHATVNLNLRRRRTHTGRAYLGTGPQKPHHHHPPELAPPAPVPIPTKLSQPTARTATPHLLLDADKTTDESRRHPASELLPVPLHISHAHPPNSALSNDVKSVRSVLAEANTSVSSPAQVARTEHDHRGTPERPSRVGAVPSQSPNPAPCCQRKKRANISRNECVHIELARVIRTEAGEAGGDSSVLGVLLGEFGGTNERREWYCGEEKNEMRFSQSLKATQCLHALSARRLAIAFVAPATGRAGCGGPRCGELTKERGTKPPTGPPKNAPDMLK
uniref:Uncharacterized protein n=1 Tax=Mycena chlorophos TaxID=658473 RepID=A0ABQ0KUL1_MYCCL|nr:predicted protein [Mycena chlorophos]